MQEAEKQILTYYVIHKGATQTITFELPLEETEQISCARLAFERDDEVVLRKTEKDSTIEGNVVSVHLSQEDTFVFDCDTFYLMQLRIKLANGQVLKTDPFRVLADKCLDEEVI